MSVKYYDTERAVSEYLLFHYGAPPERLPPGLAESGALDFPTRCVTQCVDLASLPEDGRALDLGCAVGRSAFELARRAREVLGIDASRHFIEIALHLRDHGSFPFQACEEGELARAHCAVVPGGVDRRRVQFETGDALGLRPDLGVFDVVLAANLLDRVAEPRRLLARCASLVQPGGQLVLTSPYTWLPDYTPRANWLGGFEENGRPVTAFETIRAELAPHFELEARRDLPFVIREHARKFQLGIADATRWRRRRL